jgi:uncharacterized protein (DUF2141 family)
MKNKLLFPFLLLLLPFWASSQTAVNIRISGIRNTSGNIRLAFYSSQENFENEKPLFVKTISKKEISKGTLSATYTLQPGTYGIAMLDDENGNKEMDYGLVMPKEGFGFSDYYHTGMSRPTFSDFKFTLKNEAKAIQIKVRYL